MLVLLFGPSGVGKSAVIDELVHEWGWKAIPSYITRPARPREVHKIAVSESEYQMLLKRDMLFTHVTQLGGMYGTLREDIVTAVRSYEPFVLDFSLQHYQYFFSNVPNRSFVILPESLGQLQAQLEAAGRLDRVAAAAQDLAKFAEDSLARELKNQYEVIINRSDNLQDTICQLMARVIL